MKSKNTQMRLLECKEQRQTQPVISNRTEQNINLRNPRKIKKISNRTYTNFCQLKTKMNQETQKEKKRKEKKRKKKKTTEEQT